MWHIFSGVLQRWARQCSRPYKISCKCSLFHFSFGNSFFKSFSVCSTDLPFVSPQRVARRCMWVSTGKVGTPKACIIITEAVLCPTPGRLSRISISCGTSPEYLSIRILESAIIFFDLLFESPQGRIISRTLSTPKDNIFSGLSASLKSSGVTSFTRLSVHCADSRTAIKKVKGFVKRSGISTLGYSFSRCCRMKSAFCAFVTLIDIIS